MTTHDPAPEADRHYLTGLVTEHEVDPLSRLAQLYDTAQRVRIWDDRNIPPELRLRPATTAPGPDQPWYSALPLRIPDQNTTTCYEVVLSEGGIERLAGRATDEASAAEVFAEFRHLIELASDRRVTLQVWPFATPLHPDAPLTVPMSYSIFTTPGSDEVTWATRLTGATESSLPDTITYCRNWWGYLQATALPPDRTREFLHTRTARLFPQHRSP